MLPYLIGAALLVAVLAMKRSASGGGGARVSAIDAEPTQAVSDAIASGCASAGIPFWFGLANAAMESRFRPGAGLNTLAGGAGPGAIAERSIGLMQINVNPGTPTGRSRIATIKGLLGGGAGDADVVTWLKDPLHNVTFWASRIAAPLAARASSEGRVELAQWEAVRVWLASGNLDPARGDGLRRVNLYRPVADKWRGRTFGV